MDFLSKEHKAYAKHCRLWNAAPEDLEMIRVGILGCARIAVKTVFAIKQVRGVKVVAVGSRSQEKAREFAARHDIARCYEGYDAVLEDPEVDAVYIPLPTSLHLEWVVKAARLGKHVMVEKPVALSGAELVTMLKECFLYKVAFLDGTMFMHHDRLSTIAKDLEDEKFGIRGPTCVSSAFCFPASNDFLSNNIRVRGDGDPLGVLGDLGWYNVRLALFAFKWELPDVASAVVNAYADDSKKKVPLDMSCTLLWRESQDEDDLDARGLPQVRSSNFHISFMHAHQQWALIAGESGILGMEDFCLPRSSDVAYWRDETDFQQELSEEHGTTISSQKKIFKTEACRQECVMWDRFRNHCNATKTGAQVRFWPGVALATQLVLDALLSSATEHAGAQVKVDPEGLMDHFTRL